MLFIHPPINAIDIIVVLLMIFIFLVIRHFEKKQINLKYIKQLNRIKTEVLNENVVQTNKNDTDTFADLKIVAKKYDKAFYEMDLFFKRTKELVFVASPTHFLRLSDYWEEVTGYTTEELCSVPYISFVWEKDRKKTFDEINRMFKENDSVYDGFCNHYITKDGKKLCLRWKTTTWDQYGNTSGVVDWKYCEKDGCFCVNG